MLTVRQAAAVSGVSASLVYAWCEDGTLPHSRLGRKGCRGVIRIAPADLDAALASFKVTSPRAASAPASPGPPAAPFSELDPDRLRRAWKPG